MHFLVAVFHEKDQDVENMLSPFDENLEVDPIYVCSREEAIQYMREWDKDATDDECLESYADEYGLTILYEDLYQCYNKCGFWDWYEIGGRWSGLLKINGNPVNQGKVSEVEFPEDFGVYAMITPEGNWVDEPTKAELDEYISSNDLYVTIVDCHE